MGLLYIKSVISNGNEFRVYQDLKKKDFVFILKCDDGKDRTSRRYATLDELDTFLEVSRRPRLDLN